MNGHAAGSAFDSVSDNRRELGSVNILPVEYPPSILTDGLSPDAVAMEMVGRVNKSLQSKDYDSVAELFTEISYWRDHLCLTWDLRTFNGPKNILSVLKKECRLTCLSLDKQQPHRAPQISPLDAGGRVQTIQFFVLVSTTIGEGIGLMRLTQSNGYWKILTAFTTLKQITGFEEPRGVHRPVGKKRKAQNSEAPNQAKRRKTDENFEENGPAVVIIGAGQAGLAVAARLKMLGVDALVIDRAARVGDNWRSRYRTLALHDPVWLEHMPYMPFPDTWPIFTAKDKLASFLEAYAEILELDIWTKTSMVSCSWDECNKHWSVKFERQMGARQVTRTVYPRHIIQATGHAGMKNLPTVKGMDSFKGRLCHSSEFSGADPYSQGKRAVVVGSGNSAHDIAQDFYSHGYEVTMVQRSTTCVVSSEAFLQIGLHPLYSEDGPPVEDADIIMWSRTTSYHKKQQQEVAALQAKNDKEKLEALRRIGFLLDRGPDHAGLMYKYFQRGGGYYIDAGGSQLIIDGKIKVKCGQEIEEVLDDGVKFPDGSVLPADEIVFATGYQNMRTQSRLIFGDKVADRLNDVWGFDEEGEIRTMWRPSGHPGFWFMGGNLMLCRYFSRCVALQIKAYEAGLMKY